MTEILPYSTYTTYSELVQGFNPVGQIKNTRHSQFDIAPALAGHGFALPVISSPLEDPTISYGPYIQDLNAQTQVYSDQVAALYERRNSYLDVSTTPDSLDIYG